MKFRGLKLTTKVMLGMGLILFATDCVVSIFFYSYVRNLYLDEIYEKTGVTLGFIDATMEFVRDDLRPRMLHLLPRDEFVSEAMSTSVVNKKIMSRFITRFPSNVYRRVALNPMNPNNRADEFEAAFIRRFGGSREEETSWKGLVSRHGTRYFIRLKAVRMESSCLLCHGDPALAPKSLLRRYGSKNGHNWQVGEVVGLESIAVPVDPTFSKIRQAAFGIFLLGLVILTVVLVLLNYFHYVVAVRPLKRASAFFKSVVSGEKGLDVSLDVKGSDEIAELGESFNRMIGHLKKSQDDLRASEAKYRQIFEGSKDGIIVTDCEGLMVDVNNAGIELFGCKNREDFMRSVTIHDFFVHQETCMAFLEQMETAGFVKDFEARFRKRDNDEIDVLITATRQQDKHQRRCRYECIIKDIGEWKSMEQQIRQAEKLASIGQLAAGVAHEINNPLSIVMGYTGLLLKTATDERTQRDLQVVRNNAAMCKKIVEDLLNFSRQADTRFVRADIAETIRSVIEVVDGEFAAKGIDIRTAFSTDVPPVPMSVDRIRQICLNLLINASQAIDGRGTIMVTTSYEPGDNMVRVSFTDTGRGIPAAIRHRIFEPFFTTKEPGQGTGLGTAVSYGIVEEHGGEISFTSEEGKGTTFWFRLPLEGKTQ
ncbi:DUF3365 domain-containing protein [Thermodesulfobacteriota bacterium B35]